MEAFETTLTGSDGNIDGIVTHISSQAYQFTSLDDALHLTIVKNEQGKWVRLSGSEPYFSGWVDELSENIAAHLKSGVKPVVVQKAATPASEKKVTATKKSSAASKTSTKATKAKTAVVAPSVKKIAIKAESDKKITAKTAPVKKARVSSATTKK